MGINSHNSSNHLNGPTDNEEPPNTKSQNYLTYQIKNGTR